MVEKPAPDRVRIPRESMAAWSRLHREMKRRLAATDADYRKYAGEPSDGEILHRLIELGCQVYGVDPPVPYDAPFYEAPPREMVDVDRLLGPLRTELERMLEEIEERARLSAHTPHPGLSSLDPKRPRPKDTPRRGLSSVDPKGEPIRPPPKRQDDA